jgi:segregation and condensation protein B
MFKTASDLAFIMQKEAKIQKKLSKAALETLSIIAYHQPVSRAEIEEIRGVTVSPGTIDTLMEINWVKIRGRRKTPGNPITYGTTDEFLVHFDLENIKELPGLDELKSTGLLDSNLPPDMYPIDDDLEPIEENN